jgi:MoxR-like ATPase
MQNDTTLSQWRIDGPTTELARRRRGENLPSARMVEPAMLDPSRYIPEEGLIDAIHSAVLLGQPLLVTVEPGCGKTEVANFIAYQFGLERSAGRPERSEYALRFDTKSTTSARDLFYSFDTIRRFHAARLDERDATDPRRFITFHALGRALLDAANSDDIADISGFTYIRDNHAPSRSVVLIDEIDKAPRDVPNDLLMEVDRMAFYIIELDRTIKANPAFRPIVVLTSNSERVLPEAFLRRCVFYAMPFPQLEKLRKIVENRIPFFPSEAPLVSDALNLFMELRESNLQKTPGTAELLGFLHALLGTGYKPESSLHELRSWEGLAKATLLKTREDQEQFTNGELFRVMRHIAAN